MKTTDPDAKESGVVNGIPSASRDHLVERVASSSAFGKSNRLRELFLFLCRREVSDPNGAVREQEIGIEVFDRQRDYDTAQDAIVRVQVSQLRKRLEQYFAFEGQNEPVVIEIPKGAYTPVFRPRLRESTKAMKWIRKFPILAAAVIMVAAGWLFWPGYLGSPTDRSRGVAPAATVDRLWYQMFDNGRPTRVVLSDANLGLFEDAIGHQFTLNEYRSKDFNRLADELLVDRVERAKWKQVVGQYFTHISDARLAATFAVLNAGRNLPTQIVFAQDFGVNDLQSHNLILVGTRRTNPWVELFEDQLNFRSVFQEKPTMLASFQNRTPLPGESATYVVRWLERGYCRLAFLPSPTRSGNVLLISGTDMASSEAGGQFISSERWVKALGEGLGLSRNARFPYFEVLLKVDYQTYNTPTFDMVAHRSLRY